MPDNLWKTKSRHWTLFFGCVLFLGAVFELFFLHHLAESLILFGCALLYFVLFFLRRTRPYLSISSEGIRKRDGLFSAGTNLKWDDIQSAALLGNTLTLAVANSDKKYISIGRDYLKVSDKKEFLDLLRKNLLERRKIAVDF